MWSFVPSCQEDSSVTDTSSRSPLNVQIIILSNIKCIVLLQARINVPAPSVEQFNEALLRLPTQLIHQYRYGFL